MNRTLRVAALSVACLVALATASLAADAPAEPPRQVAVVGNGNLVQTAIRYKPTMTLSEAIGDAGGISDLGTARIALIRNAKSTPINLWSIQKDPKKDVPLQPWDIIYVYYPIPKS